MSSSKKPPAKKQYLSGAELSDDLREIRIVFVVQYADSQFSSVTVTAWKVNSINSVLATFCSLMGESHDSFEFSGSNFPEHGFGCSLHSHGIQKDCTWNVKRRIPSAQAAAASPLSSALKKIQSNAAAAASASPLSSAPMVMNPVQASPSLVERMVGPFCHIGNDFKAVCCMNCSLVTSQLILVFSNNGKADKVSVYCCPSCSVEHRTERQKEYQADPPPPSYEENQK